MTRKLSLKCERCGRELLPYRPRTGTAHIAWWRADGERVHALGVYCAGECLTRVDRRMRDEAHVHLSDLPLDCFYREYAWVYLRILLRDFEWTREQTVKLVEMIFPLSKAKGPINELVYL